MVVYYRAGMACSYRRQMGLGFFRDFLCRPGFFAAIDAITSNHVHTQVHMSQVNRQVELGGVCSHQAAACPQPLQVPVLTAHSLNPAVTAASRDRYYTHIGLLRWSAPNRQILQHKNQLRYDRYLHNLTAQVLSSVHLSGPAQTNHSNSSIQKLGQVKLGDNQILHKASGHRAQRTRPPNQPHTQLTPTPMHLYPLPTAGSSSLIPPLIAQFSGLYPQRRGDPPKRTYTKRKKV